MTQIYYAGIGSRKTPKDVLNNMRLLGLELADAGLILRSGGAAGADSEFERGCNLCDDGKKEIFLPWKGFNDNQSPLCNPSKEAFELAELYHPAWRNCKTGVRKLHARNMHIILGQDLKTPVSFVVCWHQGSGGTMQAVRLAENRNIPVFNLADTNYEEVCRKIKELLTRR